MAWSGRRRRSPGRAWPRARVTACRTAATVSGTTASTMPKPQQVPRGEAEGAGEFGRPRAVAVKNGGPGFRTDDGEHGAVEREQPVGMSQGHRAAAAALTDAQRHTRAAQFRHRQQRPGDLAR